MSDQRAYQELAQQIVELQRRLDGLSTSQLAHSSLENTGLPTYNQTGQLSGMMGRLPDGSYGTATLSGPVPPIPSAPKVRAVRGVGLEIEWDGLFQDVQAVVPLEGGRLEVYVSEDVNITPVMVPVYSMASPRGEKFLISVGYDKTHYVAFAFRAASGKVSPASAVVGPCTVGRATKEDLDVNFETLNGINIFYGAADPIADASGSDLWYAEIGTDADGNPLYESRRLVNGEWKPLADQSANTALVEAIAASTLAGEKAKWVTSDTPPTPAPGDDYYPEHHTLWWIDSANGNRINAWHGDETPPYWHEHKLGNGAIQPGSLVASDVIATGTINAALFEALLVLTTEIIAGDPLGDHARMTPNGFRVFQNDPIDGVPNEVIRMGTETNDYFGVVNSNGDLVASIDDTGQVSARLMTTSALIVAGRDLSVAVNSAPHGEVAHFLGSIGFDYGPIFNPVGVAEVGLQVEKGRSYHFKWRMPVYLFTAGVQAQVNGRWTEGNDGDTATEPPAPTISSASFAEWRSFPSAGQNGTETIDGEAIFVASRTTRVRLGLTIQTGPDGAFGNVGVRNASVEINVLDVGRHVDRTGAFTNMGGSLNGQTSAPPPPSVSQQYYVDLAPAGWTALRGDGSTRTDVPGPVQGWDPSGYNGNGKGHWWFNMPNITGTVDRMDFYAYSNHWYNNSGGTAVFNIATGNTPYSKPFGDWHSGGWPKPGGREVRLPSEWYPYFRSAGAGGRPQANGITIGPGPNNDGLYYGRFDGPSARLRIYFTQ